MRYGIDEQIIDNLKKGLETNDKELIEEYIGNLENRISGMCFCAAHSSMECLCGAWDGEWDD